MMLGGALAAAAAGVELGPSVRTEERGRNRGPQKTEWSLYSVKKCRIDATWSLKVSY